jgi:hypothetical protein
VLHFNEKRTHMGNVHHLLDERMQKRLGKFSYDLDNAWRSAITRRYLDPTHGQVRSIFKSLNRLIRDRRDVHDSLCSKNMYAIQRGKIPQNELKELRARLADDPRHVLLSFHKRIANNDVDLDDPDTLAALKAASEILAHFLQLEHDYIRTYLEEAQTHLRLQRARRRQQTLLLSQSKQVSPQKVDGTR